MNWHEYFFNICNVISMKSKDNSTKVGCVIASSIDNSILSTGYNGFCRGIEEYDDRMEKEVKYFYTEHSERNAIYAAAKNGVCLNNAKIYINSLPPCSDCARAIIQVGIKEVHILNQECPERWKQSCKIGLEMLIEAGIDVFAHNPEQKVYFHLNSVSDVINELPLKLEEFDYISFIY